MSDAPKQAESAEDTRLRDLIFSKFPEFFDSQGRFAVTSFAHALRVSRQTPYLWFKDNTLSTGSAAKLIGLSKGRLTGVDLVPFLLSE